MKIGCYLFFIFALCCCTAKREQISTNTIEMGALDNYPAVRLHASVRLLQDTDVFYPWDLWIQDSVLIINSNQSKENYFLHYYSLNSLKILGRFGKSGRGPGEYQVAKVQWKDAQSLLVTEKLKYSIVYTDSLLRNPDYMPPKKNLQLNLRAANYACFLNDSLLLSNSLMEDNQFTIANLRTNQFIAKYRNHPHIANHPKITPFIATSKVYLAHFIVKPYTLDTVAAIYRYYPVIDFIALTDFHTTRIEWDINPQFNQVKVLDSLNAVIVNKQYYYRSHYATPQYLYLLYNERSNESAWKKENELEIHQYDWQGNFVHRYQLDHYITTFCMNEQNNKIYGININENNENDVEVICFSLPPQPGST